MKCDLVEELREQMRQEREELRQEQERMRQEQQEMIDVIGKWLESLLVSKGNPLQYKLTFLPFLELALEGVIQLQLKWGVRLATIPNVSCTQQLIMYLPSIGDPREEL